MKKNLLIFACVLLAWSVGAQSNNPAVSSWMLNTTGQMAVYEKYNNVKTGGATTTVDMTDSAGVLKVCYTSSNVYVKTNDLAPYTMGPWLSDPNVPKAQGLTFKFPLNPTQETVNNVGVPSGGTIAVGVNGVLFYGFRDADSYSSTTNSNSGSGDGLWHTDAWYNEGSSMDPTGNAHSDANGNYHNHANPITLYSDPSSNHSPIIGFALDGYPIYGPFGYSSAMDNTSSIQRMAGGYQLRSITQRTTLPDGSISNPAGPDVSSSFPLGMYCEDYAFVGGGDLDSMNGRYCVTPEYPSGTYAYFISTTSSGDPFYPYFIGSYYYGKVSPNVLGPNTGKATIPSSGVTCLSGTITSTSGVTSPSGANVSIYPNPVSDLLYIESTNGTELVSLTIMDAQGRIVRSAPVHSSQTTISTSNLGKGLYVLSLMDSEGNPKVVKIEKK